MKKLKMLAIIFTIIAVIGLISFVTGTRSVNIGAFVFPAILAIAFAICYVRKNNNMDKKLIANFRIGLLIIWIVLAFALLLLIQYAKVNVEAQNFVTMLVRVYLFSSFVVIGIRAWLKRKLFD